MSGGSKNSSPDILDARDKLLLDLSKYINFTVDYGESGEAKIRSGNSGNGNILLEMANSLELMLDGQDDGNLFDNSTQEMLELIEDYAIAEFIPEGVKSWLRRRRIDDSFGTLDGDNKNTDQGDGLNLGPDGFPLDGVASGIDIPDTNSELYEAIDGNIYILKVEDDPTSPEVALRRFGVAQTTEGVTVLKSPPTFTTKAKTILADIRVRLDTQLSIL